MPDAPVALITGASSGIGLAAARGFLAEGYRVVMVARHAERLRAAGEGLGEPGRVRTVPADVGDEAQARAVVGAAVDAFGRLDVLVNNAGVAPLVPIGETSPELLLETFRVNALGPANTIAAAWAVFERQRSGVVVNVSTFGTKDPFPGFFAYAAAKSAGESLIRSVRNEGASSRIRGYAVAPGAVETPMLRGLFGEDVIPRAGTLAPEDVAAVILDCAAGRTSHPSGSVIYLPSPVPGDAPPPDATREESPALDLVLRDAWARLEWGAGDRHHPYHLATLATAGVGDGAAARTVVLRAADGATRELVCHTDARSPKCEAVRADPRTSWLFYDPGSRVQIRVRAHAAVHTDDVFAEARWRASALTSRRCYLAPRAPGAAVAGSAPDPNLPESVRGRVPTEEEAEPGRVHFAAIRARVTELEWLHLRHDGHRRARFAWGDDGSLSAGWIAP